MDDLTTRPKRVIFAGTPKFAAHILSTLIEHQDALNIEIVAVYTQIDRKKGRGQKHLPSPVKEVAKAHHIPFEQPISLSKKTQEGADAQATFAAYAPDVMVVVAYGLLLPVGILETPTYGCLNVHASLLPRWRGAAPLQRAILAGDTVTGVSIMQMDAGLDTGKVLLERSHPIATTTTTQDLHDTLKSLGADALMQVLSDVTHYLAHARPQAQEGITYAKKLTKKEGALDFGEPCTVLLRQIRALETYTHLEGMRVKVLSAHPIPRPSTQQVPVGQITACEDGAIWVQTADAVLGITSAQLAGKGVLSGHALTNHNAFNIKARFVTL